MEIMKSVYKNVYIINFAVCKKKLIRLLFRDYIDYALKEIQETKDPNSSFFGKTGRK